MNYREKRLFVATYVWIKSEVLDIGLWNFYHLFFIILSIFMGMESTLAKKITTTIFYFIFWDIFIYFICNFFFSHSSLFSIPKKLLHIVRARIKKESWQVVKKKKLFKVKNVKKMPKKLKIFSLKILKGAEIF